MGGYATRAIHPRPERRGFPRSPDKAAFLKPDFLPTMMIHSKLFATTTLTTFSCFFAPVLASPAKTPAQLNTLASSLDPQSASEHLAFYELYPTTEQGRLALRKTYELLTGQKDYVQEDVGELTLHSQAVEAIVSLVNPLPTHTTAPILREQQLALIDKLAAKLPNRKLKGHLATSEEEVLALDSSEVDLARGLLLSQMETTTTGLAGVRSYEALLDLMALQILCRTSLNAPPEEKIRAMNRLIFKELHFRFPPHSLYSDNVDLYTLLPAVLDSRRGICLGVSTLYICLAQRLGLTLEMITPPGHIYVRYRDGDEIINIETTARGIDLPSEIYLSVNTRSLQERNIKEVVGLTYQNQAAAFWHQKDYNKAIQAYLKALQYIPGDPLLNEFLAYQYLFIGETKKGKEILKTIRNLVPDYAVSKDTIIQDYLDGNTSAEGLKTVMMEVDETRESILKKQEKLQELIKKYPKFRTGWFYLAITWLQLNREQEGLEALKVCHRLDATNPTVEYYLAALYLGRFDYNNAWKHFRIAESLVRARDHHPSALDKLMRELLAYAPE